MNVQLTSFFPSSIHTKRNKLSRKAAQLVPIGMPTVCWNTRFTKRNKMMERKQQASCIPLHNSLYVPLHNSLYTFTQQFVYLYTTACIPLHNSLHTFTQQLVYLYTTEIRSGATSVPRVASVVAPFTLIMVNVSPRRGETLMRDHIKIKGGDFNRDWTNPW